MKDKPEELMFKNVEPEIGKALRELAVKYIEYGPSFIRFTHKGYHFELKLNLKQETMNLRDINQVEIDGLTIEVNDAWIEGTTLTIDDERGSEWKAEVHGYREQTGEFWGDMSDLEFEQTC